MAITNKQLADKLKFVMLRDSKNMIKPVGDDIIFTASKGHIYLNGMHLINTEFIDVKFLGDYLSRVINAKKKSTGNVGSKASI